MYFQFGAEAHILSIVCENGSFLCRGRMLETPRHVSNLKIVFAMTFFKTITKHNTQHTLMHPQNDAFIFILFFYFFFALKLIAIYCMSVFFFLQFKFYN